MQAIDFWEVLWLLAEQWCKWASQAILKSQQFFAQKGATVKFSINHYQQSQQMFLKLKLKKNSQNSKMRLEKFDSPRMELKCSNMKLQLMIVIHLFQSYLVTWPLKIQKSLWAKSKVNEKDQDRVLEHLQAKTRIKRWTFAKYITIM